MNKKAVIIAVIIALVGAGFVVAGYFVGDEKPKETKQSVAQDKEIAKKQKEEKKVEKAVETAEPLTAHPWVGKNDMGESVEIFFNTDTWLIEKTSTSGGNVAETSIEFSLSDDGTKIIYETGASSPWEIKGGKLIFEGVKYKPLERKRPTENQEGN